MALSEAKGAEALYDILYKNRRASQILKDLAPQPKLKPKGPVRSIPIIGIATPEELAEQARLLGEKKRHIERKAPPRSKNYKGPREVICPCGVVFEVPRHYPEGSKKYHTSECRRKYGYKKQYTFTPEIDAQIREAYANRVGMTKKPSVRVLAERLGFPPHAVKRRSMMLGLVNTMPYSPNRAWSDAEKAIATANAHLTCERISLKLRKAGFSRSKNACKIFIQRHVGLKPKTDYSAWRLSQCLGVDIHTVTHWISKGLLKADRRGSVRVVQQGGDTWSITPEDGKEFIVGYLHLVDFRKVDKYWIVELLTGKEIIVTV